ncbi:MAG: sulfurtransferase [Tahibacter sp.]
MNYTTLISPQELSTLCGSADLLVVDCRFDLADPERGERAWSEAHLPGAVYAHLERDLSDMSRTGMGRHPLPSLDGFTRCLARWGWTPQSQVVAYDDANGAHAARLWWMLRLVGHLDVAVLDGGFAAWKATGLPLSDDAPLVAACPVEVVFDTRQIVLFDEVQSGLADQSMLLLDARGSARFRGEVEPIDKVAGHVPGARNRPFTENLDADQRFRPAGELRDAFESVIGEFSPERVVHMCGSGVTACHNLLAMEHAGLIGSRLFAPSWSGWIADPERPLGRGAN